MIELKPEESRIILMAGPVLLKMARAREKQTLDKIYARLRSGETDFLSLISEYATIRDQIKEIETVLNENHDS